MNVLDWIGNWMLSNCDSNWEHVYGVHIETLDNPGWIVKIDLNETPLKDRTFETLDIYNSNSDWLVCRVKENIYEGFGDLFKLEMILMNFKIWVEKNADTKLNNVVN